MNANELLTPVNQVVQSSDVKVKALKDPDAIDIIVSFSSSTGTNEITVYPETKIKDITKLLSVNDVMEHFTYINLRTGKRTSNLEITMAEFNIMNNDQLVIHDDGDNA